VVAAIMPNRLHFALNTGHNLTGLEYPPEGKLALGHFERKFNKILYKLS